jgi:hypothetical protein
MVPETRGKLWTARIVTDGTHIHTIDLWLAANENTIFNDIQFAHDAMKTITRARWIVFTGKLSGTAI